MPTRRPDPARERLWRKRLARGKASGLEAREFCDQEGVTPTAFAHWRKTLRARDARAATADPPAFVPVRVTPGIAAMPLEVALGGGRALRAVAVGRKNYLFAGSDAGCQAAAFLYSVVGMCRRLGLDPFAYLRDVLLRLPGQPTIRLDEVLPAAGGRA